MKIGILLTNNDESPFSLRFPNDGRKVASQLAVIRPEWNCRVWSVKDGEVPECQDAEAFIITGSPASVHDSLPWIAQLTQLIGRINVNRIPLIGLCFGHQLIATALGGEVERNPNGWRFGAAETSFVERLPWMQPPSNRLRLYASHAEQVTRLPTDATLLGGNDYCPYASFRIDEHVITTQYHPEFGTDFMEALASEYQGEVPDHVLASGKTELKLPTDGGQFFQWAARFIEEARCNGN